MEWISVKDRLPEKDARYIVAFLTEGELCVGTALYDMSEDKRFEDDDPEYYGDEFFAHITHWMPLPAPPLTTSTTTGATDTAAAENPKGGS